MNSTVTHKLYWADAYRRHFTAQVVKRQSGDRPSVVLNRTLFYPTGGGQPHDVGRLGSARVLDVIQENGHIIHVLDREPDPGPELTGAIDWPRRWDHMQQHSGQHLLSAAFLDLFERPTVGFHLSNESVTIDIPGSLPAESEIQRVLDFVQAIIAEDRPIHSYQVSQAEAASLPLRKTPTVSGPVRVVEIEDLDWSACGGTHVRSTAAIGGVAITKVERRSQGVRIYFICGGRCYADHRQRLQVTQALGNLLTTGLSDLPASVVKLQEELSRCQKALRQAQSHLLAAQAQQLLATAPTIAGVRIVRHILDTEDAQALNHMLRSLLVGQSCLALLGWAGARPRWLVGRSSDVSLDLRALLATVRKTEGAKGGGREDLLQGGVPDLPTLQTLLNSLESSVTELLQQQ